MKNGFAVLGLLLAINFTLTCRAEEIPGPRVPLTFKDSGLYCGWNQYFLQADTPFDYFIVPAVVSEGQDISEWNDSLQKARRNGTRVIVDLVPRAKNADGEFYAVHHLSHDADDSEIEKLAAVVDDFFTQVDSSEIYAITLGEEHIFWNGRDRHLNRLYELIKAKHDVPIYQWYSPSSHGSIPGVTGWPNLKSDGWMADEYHLDQPDMERAMRGYTVMQKPIVQIIWAGGGQQSVPYIPRRFGEQWEVCRKYNIPTSYFAWFGRPGAWWGWQKQAPDSLKQTFARVLQYSMEAKLDPGPNKSSWDTVPWETPIIELAFSSSSDTSASYQEDYAQDRTLRFVNDTAITGFADLRWDSTPVELRPRQVGPAESSVAYSFASAFPISELRVHAPAFIAPETDAAVSLSVRDSVGSEIGCATLGPQGTMDLVIPGDRLSGTNFQVVYTMGGTAKTNGEVLAGVESIEVEADVVPPQEKVLELEVNDDGKVLFEEDLRDMSIYHTADIKEPRKIVQSPAGLHANSPGVLEIVQHLKVPQDINLSRLRAEGNAAANDSPAKIGIGVSLNGTDLVAQEKTDGNFRGEIVLELDDPIQTNDFYVHLFLEEGNTVIKSYAVEGDVVSPSDNQP
ncbi:hypothetical protein [Bythopirellula goksoeyrii]|uniref:Uncharacterized protein n=1 Tax=Bythopirellula goksoeyrii TaxID=1400387 RepID=A0A5B9QGL0_9BACT|nr:hypothetical protein [Bythopirellula goksoeyrii]QEG33403.1 hypothetical protein Pr1d_06660 [Bythopirellula goksoeyrii]